MKVKTSLLAKRIDRWARWAISLGGISIIASMLIMIVFMVKVALPLFRAPIKNLKAHMNLAVESDGVVAFGSGPYQERIFTVLKDGQVVVFDPSQGKELERHRLEAPAEGATAIVSATQITKQQYSFVWNNGSMSAVALHFEAKFHDSGTRYLQFQLETLVKRPAAPEPLNQLFGLVVQTEEEQSWSGRLVGDGAIHFQRVTREEDFFGEVTEAKAEAELKADTLGQVTAFTGTRDGKLVYAVTDRGELLVWDCSNGEGPILLDQVRAHGTAITAVHLLFGDVTLVLGDAMGALSAWNTVLGETPKLTQIHDFEPHQGAVMQIVPSFKDKSFATLDSAGELRLSHLTSERQLLRFEDVVLKQAMLTERGDGMLAQDRDGSFWFWSLHVPHPEITWETLWGRVFYEGYNEPVWAWQSSSASDDFEPKLSLMPLLFGSLKGTFYGLFFSLPLALFAAMYTAYMMKPKMRTVVKPMIELMAAVPSVVTGFLAALWLAPRLEGNLTGLVLALLLIPVVVGAGLLILFRRKVNLTGVEFIWSVPLILVGMVVAWKLGYYVQDLLFEGNMNLWLFQTLGLTIDQRNCIVIGFALGFAVIPIIFTISEDALYNVPKHLSAGALALGSSRWQVMRRVVLPMASPGIFAAVMIGFGRAVGETMIVLMATGNTPIMNPSIFNGMRTLSANIAVEIPEAPVDSTLYRVLFLSAVLLFTMTFVVNTGAEIVRAHLNKKYKNI